LIQAARPLDSKVAHLEGAADFCNKICHNRKWWQKLFDHLIGERDGIASLDLTIPAIAPMAALF
jgi:hypothetical protein